jgi:hypothetical protein
MALLLPKKRQWGIVDVVIGGQEIMKSLAMSDAVYCTCHYVQIIGISSMFIIICESAE